MPQIHRQQFGLFHVTSKTENNVPWCTRDGIPDVLINNLFETKAIYKAGVHAFCILPNHLHLIITTGPRGLSRFMQSFKSNSAKDIKVLLPVWASRFRWQAGFYDEWIGDERRQSAAIAYVQGNGVKHGLAKEIADWPWSSLHYLDQMDPLELW
ncbi:MAG: transposase [Candidatus Peribacteraceae bacterium]|nr:transposase [Candidatus Peribacteraceae bacterium]